jgi:N-methylhydantoinase A
MGAYPSKQSLSTAWKEERMAVRVGVDAGGTFTDVCLVDDDGELAVYKLSSSPSDPSEAIAGGVEQILAQEGKPAEDVRYLGHGTTVATNALLERRGVGVGVVTTKGFRDLLELGRQQRPDLYDLQADKPEPLVRRAFRSEVPERVQSTGDILQSLDRLAVREAVRDLKEHGVTAYAVCFLYSYLRPEHEDLVGEIIAEEHPEAFVSLSHDVLAEFREYERLSTTVVNSYVGPIMSRYIQRLRERFDAIGVPTPPYITQSNGGIISLDVASQTPVRTVLSGPAAGIVGAIAVGTAAGHPDIITFDMGGTSTDVALITGGQSSIKMEQEVAGYPIRSPMLDINTVGAGGGSIAWIDSGGHLKVGPQSAGADPGPACYMRGGTEATVTDANVALGIMSRQALLNGRMLIDATAADHAIDNLAARLSLGREEVAQGIISLATMNMARAIRVISVERGYDPRDYTMIAFGGAGPLHASRLARELDIPRILVPTIPGLLSAFGLLMADLRTDFSRTVVVPMTSESLSIVNAAFGELEESAKTWFLQEQIGEADQLIRRVADMRYVGQNYELPVQIPEHSLTADDLPAILAAFHAAHDQAYGFASADEPVQLVTIRLEASGIVAKPELQRISVNGLLDDAGVGTRHTYMPENGGWSDVPLYDRERLPANVRVKGPAIVEQMDSTTLVLPGQWADVDQFGNLIVVEAE